MAHVSTIQYLHAVLRSIRIVDQWRIQDFCEGVLEGEVPARGWVREADVPPPARSAEAFEDLVYEASWFHVHHAVAAFNKYYKFNHNTMYICIHADGTV